MNSLKHALKLSIRYLTIKSVIILATLALTVIPQMASAQTGVCTSCLQQTPIPADQPACTPTPTPTPTCQWIATGTTQCVQYETTGCNGTYCKYMQNVYRNSCTGQTQGLGNWILWYHTSAFNYPNSCRSLCYYTYFQNSYQGYCCIRDACLCFHAETKIQMADGSLKLAKDVKTGDLVYNPMKKGAAKVKGVWVGPEEPAMVKFSTSGGQTLTVTRKHPMVFADEGVSSPIDISKADVEGVSLVNPENPELPAGTQFVVRQARHAKVGDKMIAADGKVVTITKIDSVQLTSTERVYNIDLEGDGSNPHDHMLVADGIITGDGILENKGDEVVAANGANS